MYEKELFDETLDINSTNNYEISIQVSLNGFSFSLLDTLRNKFVMMREYRLSGRENELATQVEEIIFKDDFLGRQYHAYRLIYVFERNTLVPSGLFDPAVKDNYFTLNHNLEEGYLVANNRLDNPDSYILFDLRQDLQALLVKAFPDASQSHHIKPLLYSAFRTSAGNTARHIQVNIEDTFFNLVVIESGRLEFFNTFRYRNASDILYYMMFTFEKLGISSKEPLYISGEVDYGDELHTNLSAYAANIKFLKPEGSFSLSYVFDPLSLHRYSNLFNIVNCV
ncbi:MAG: DUF3822 family protein [Marinilabiliaceae bacterium]|jgi:hypothetical protein|nr:DUF3822 family protein [Marinilabiliaceae bacterium]